MTFRHPTAGFSVPLPQDWEQHCDPRPGISLVALEPKGEAPFRTNVVVTSEPLQPEADLKAWQAAMEEQLPEELPNYVLLDTEEIEEPQQMYRRLAHHAGPETGSVTMEQWSTMADGRGYTLTCSIATLAYDSLADLFVEMARDFRCGQASQEPASDRRI